MRSRSSRPSRGTAQSRGPAPLLGPVLSLCGSRSLRLVPCPVERVAEPLEPQLVVLRIAVLEEARVPIVGGNDPAGVFDGATVLLAARRDLPEVRGKAVGVSALAAVQLLERVEVGEVLAVEDHVVGAPRLRDPVD